MAANQHDVSVPQGQTVIVINNFIANTTSFLNVFAQICETKLSKVSQRLCDVELTLSLLEAKLNSVPGIAPATTRVVEQAPRQEEESVSSSEDQEEEEDATEGMVQIRSHPEFEPYFRLQKLGVPDAQIRLKMEAEGVDPTVLADGDRLIAL